MRFKIDWASLQWEGNLPFCFVLLCIREQIPKYKPLEELIFGVGDLTEGFLCCSFGGLIFGGAYTWRGLYLEFALKYKVKHSRNG